MNAFLCLGFIAYCKTQATKNIDLEGADEDTGMKKIGWDVES